MKQVLTQQGSVFVEEVPAPIVEPGTVLVRVDHSCISSGTELSGIRATGTPLWKKALAQPEKVRKAYRMLMEQGFAKTRSIIQGAVTAIQPIGYSAAGTVMAVGAGISDLQVGDRVACAGAQCSFHAEVIRVPRNLVVPIPDGVSLADASTVTLGAIALQGVRRTNPTLGESVVVIGLGILGQLTVQLLKANGCRVIGIDLDPERIRQAEVLGMDLGVVPRSGPDVDQVWRLTDGVGADAVIITAASPSDEVVSTAFRMCRRKARVVLVGDVGLNLRRADFYTKELDFLVSTSYGPGRYDAHYEEGGLDYPLAYVRWTENRNMAEYLRLIASGRIAVAPLITETFEVSQARAAYARLQVPQRPMILLLSYPSGGQSPAVRTVPNPAAHAAGPGQIRLALVGAGSFARGMHLPNLQALADHYQVRAIVSRTGHNATTTAKQFGASYASTDFDAVLADRDVDAVLIATRHNLHAPMALAGLRAGKHVLVEKPLALTERELTEISAFYAAAGDTTPILLTGFNRRFSRYARRLRELTRERSNPMLLNYRMNAGYLPLDHWVHSEEGGGRNLGEACHIYDLFTFLTQSKVAEVQAQALTPRTAYYSRRDNFVATMSFEDGSVATLTYTALGHSSFPKEQLEVYVDGKVLILNDYKELSIIGSPQKGLSTKESDKGQREELEAFAHAIQGGGEWPIALWEQFQAMEIAFAVERCF